jgi:glucose-1-phosphate thymidylyltransferase
MKGVILAGGTGSRLQPLTKITNKHLLPVYNQPMIYHPLQTLLQADIKDIIIISGPEHAGDFLRLLGSGKDFIRPSGKRIKLTYEIQDEAGGIAQALLLARDFVDDDNCTVILGDNIFEDNFSETILSFDRGARIFLKEVPDPHRFGVANVKGEKVLTIEEKPKNPKSNWAVTGLYIYDTRVFDIIKTLKPSRRGELEITDVNNHYIAIQEMKASFVQGSWTDAGTFESLYRATTLARSIQINHEQ